MTIHKSVLLEEAISGLNLKEGMTVVDATLGGGGHSIEILKIILPEGRLIAIDRDAEAIKRFKNKIKELKIKIKPQNLILVQNNFSQLNQILRDNAIEKVDAILADFGLSSDQLDNKERGFSFNSKSVLDMRMDKRQEITAQDIVNRYSQESLIKIIRDLGEEKFAFRIVEKIVQARKEKEIERTDELVKIISQAIPERDKRKKIHFATKTFQAIRMEVNQELENINKFLGEAISGLIVGGRLAVISFHSGEDRLVKNIFKEARVNCICPVEFPVCRCKVRAKIKAITKKPTVASKKEIEINPRSRSAKLRIIERI
ncbi:MAG: 16S rRNA (cytosine(1402)-N(4))-methyltransferase RsmH [Parcubacteria group bacterium]|jgi:16S rRNA (cytosine1402-N4)-methyltransferase